MLTKIGVAALLGTIGAAAAGGTASAHEPYRNPPVRVTIAAPVAMPVSYGTPGVYYRNDDRQDRRDSRDERREDRRDELARLQRQRREEALRHARWLHEHQGWGYGRGDRR